RRTILIAHPTVGADEAELPTWCECRQATFEEADENIAAAPHGRPGHAVGCCSSGVEVVVTDVGRIAHGYVGRTIIDSVQQEVGLQDPSFGDPCGGVARNACGVKQCSA